MTLDVGRSFATGQAILGRERENERQQQIQQLQQSIASGGGNNPLFNQEIQQLTGLDPQLGAQALSTFNALSDGRKKAFFDDAESGLNMLNQGNFEGVMGLVNQRRQLLQQIGGDTSDVDAVAQSLQQGDIQGAKAQLEQAVFAGQSQGFLKEPESRRGRTAGQKEFESLTEGLTKDQKKEAALIELGLSPRAVGSAIQTISDKGIEDQIGKVKATIRQREKFGELTATRRSKVIDSGFNKIEKINAAVRNIDKAITVLNSGAGVGAIQKFLPSFKAASVELDNIQKSMALDVIGSVTFGALSQGELDLAKEVALPTGLDTPQLIDHLNRRKDAQNKLRDYYGEQIQFLDQGGTVAGFMRSKEREQDQQPQAQPVQQPVTQPLSSSVLGREISEQDISDTLQANPGLTREQLLQQLGVN